MVRIMDDEKVVKEMQGSHWVWDAQRDADGFDFLLKESKVGSERNVDLGRTG